MLSEYGVLTYEDCFGTLYGYRSGEIPDSYLKRLPELCEENTLEENFTVIKSKETV